MERSQPDRSSIIWFSQRTGSTLLAAALASTGNAGSSREALNDRDPATFTLDELHQVWQQGMTSNGFFSLKYGPTRGSFDAWTQAFRTVQGLPAHFSAAEIWATTFPNCRHIFITRRDKVRLAVSWWRAIQSGEWHRPRGETPHLIDLTDSYSYEAVDHLFVEASLREVMIGDIFTNAGIQPLTVVYEDFIRDYEQTVREALKFLGLEAPEIIELPAFERLADPQAERWVQQFRAECQAGWPNPVW